MNHRRGAHIPCSDSFCSEATAVPARLRSRFAPDSFHKRKQDAPVEMALVTAQELIGGSLSSGGLFGQAYKNAMGVNQQPTGSVCRSPSSQWSHSCSLNELLDHRFDVRLQSAIGRRRKTISNRRANSATTVCPFVPRLSGTPAVGFHTRGTRNVSACGSMNRSMRIERSPVPSWLQTSSSR
jgi:hypothetical protein